MRERKRKGVNSLPFSRFGVIKKKKQEEGRRKEKIKVRKNQTINPFFDEFGSKRTLLGILVVFGNFRLDLELF